VRLDPANYHRGKSYGSQGGMIHVDIDAQQPVSIFMTGASEWNRAMQNPEMLGNIRTVCLREHVIKATYTCDLPLEPMELIVRDDRESQSSTAFAGLGAVLKSTESLATVEPELGRAMGVVEAVGTGIGSMLGHQSNATPRHFIAPNDVHIQYYRWICISNCFPPQFQWIQQAREEFKLTPFLKVYGGYAPGPRRRGGQRQDQGASAHARGGASLIGSESTARQAGDARTGARKNTLPAARRAVANVPVHVQRGGRAAIADCGAGRYRQGAAQESGG